MRKNAFNIKPEELGVSLDNDDQVYGCVVDMAMGNGNVVTMVCYFDGTASLYYSTGGGIIGSGQHENVRKAVGSFLVSIHQVLPIMKKTENFDTAPKENHQIFYLFTRVGVYTYDLDLSVLNRQKEVNFLFSLSQMVLSEIRIAHDESQNTLNR